MILFFSLFLLGSCHKENAKKEYEMVLFFETGDIWKSDGRIFEKNKKYRKYENDLKNTYFNDFWIKNHLFSSCFDGLDFVKYDERFGGHGMIKQQIESPVTFANNQTGYFEGTLVFEGNYTQKGRAYTVETGTFQFYWSNAWAFGEFDTIINGTWSLKRK